MTRPESWSPKRVVVSLTGMTVPSGAVSAKLRVTVRPLNRLPCWLNGLFLEPAVDIAVSARTKPLKLALKAGLPSQPPLVYPGSGTGSAVASPASCACAAVPVNATHSGTARHHVLPIELIVFLPGHGGLSRMDASLVLSDCRVKP